MSNTKKQEELEKEDEQAKLLHVLRLPPQTKFGICASPCEDPVCSIGCLQQRGTQFRPQIMQGIRICRERNWYKYPLYLTAFENQSKMPCPESPLEYCNDPVCNVSGCLKKPALNFRHLIRIALTEQDK